MDDLPSRFAEWCLGPYRTNYPPSHGKPSCQPPPPRQPAHHCSPHGFIGWHRRVWVGAYLKIKGENLATKQNFDDLLKQQEETAKAVEDIKSEISQRDWARREWANLRRIKL